jgi:rubrerythrin
MITKTERISITLAQLDMASVQRLYDERAKMETDRQAGAQRYLERQGYELVSVNTDKHVAPDGREIVWIDSSAWALRPEIHAERLNQRIAEAQEREAAKRAAQAAETNSVAGTESLSALTCPKCGDSLQHTRVCPSCPAGKIGYRHRYTCVCGGVDLVSKEPL